MPLRTSRILASVSLMALLLVVPCLSGCAVERETTLSRTARQRGIEARRTARDRLQRERDILVEKTAELQVEIGVARAESVRTAAQLRATLAGLDHELDRLHHAEQDLESAKARALAIEEELKPLRVLEKTLREQEQLRAAAEQRVALLQEEVRLAEAAADKVAAELEPQLAALRQRLQQAQEVSQAISAAEAAVAAAAKALAPAAPDAPSPGAPSTPTPVKK